jgi:hypothetical protein
MEAQGMDDYFYCRLCSGVIKAMTPVCPSCQKDYHNCQTTRELFSFCNRLDKLLDTGSIKEGLSEIQQSGFRQEPMVQYRKARFLLKDAVDATQPFRRQQLISVLAICLPIAEVTHDCWTSIVPYLASLLPSPSLRIQFEECLDILQLTQIPRLDQYAILRKKLIDQVKLMEN